MNKWEELMAPFPEEAISYVIIAETRGRDKNIWAPYLKWTEYVKRLNSVLGPDGWTFQILLHSWNPDHSECEVIGRLTLRVGDKEVFRDGVGIGRGSEAIKEGASDAFKRACILFGISFDQIYTIDLQTLPKGECPHPVPPATYGDQAPPHCPECDAPMKLRVSKENNKFWGCSRYPECKGTRPYQSEQNSVHPKLKKIFALLNEREIPYERAKPLIQEWFGVASSRELTDDQMDKIIASLMREEHDEKSFMQTLNRYESRKRIETLLERQRISLPRAEKFIFHFFGVEKWKDLTAEELSRIIEMLEETGEISFVRMLEEFESTNIPF